MQQFNTHGKVFLQPTHAHLTHDTDWVFKMDPYVKFVHNANTYKTSTCYGGGKKPSWNDVIEFHAGANDIIIVEIWDHNTFERNEAIAIGEFQVSNIVANGNNWNAGIPLTYCGDYAGEIKINCTYTPTSGSGPVFVQGGYPQYQQQENFYGGPQYQQQQQVTETVYTNNYGGGYGQSEFVEQVTVNNGGYYNPPQETVIIENGGGYYPQQETVIVENGGGFYPQQETVIIENNGGHHHHHHHHHHGGW